eukprot:CAMPEP_0119321546 /NCGR_PEP_ID=MMETSP1333-20130426/55688_1 /TAXON_ID=418940 /ORGANISM="Scyphosphaera apsteinii, Strain RCC1455" /LENGTH=304 /DNA_ID=CAMNT_0007328547 /DNA_START=333 /DNA_END=1248 /DNA_ORIENTATION=+
MHKLMRSFDMLSSQEFAVVHRIVSKALMRLYRLLHGSTKSSNTSTTTRANAFVAKANAPAAHAATEDVLKSLWGKYLWGSSRAVELYIYQNVLFCNCGGCCHDPSQFHSSSLGGSAQPVQPVAQAYGTQTTSQLPTHPVTQHVQSYPSGLGGFFAHASGMSSGMSSNMGGSNWVVPGGGAFKQGSCWMSSMVSNPLSVDQKKKYEMPIEVCASLCTKEPRCMAFEFAELAGQYNQCQTFTAPAEKTLPLIGRMCFNKESGVSFSASGTFGSTGTFVNGIGRTSSTFLGSGSSQSNIQAQGIGVG